MVYQNPDDPFGKKEVFVPPPRKAGSVAAMAKMFSSNVGLEDQSTNNASANASANLIGILNTGNSCYMSSTVQCLYVIPELKSFLVEGEYLKSLNVTNSTARGR